jgi:hypothetical protein
VRRFTGLWSQALDYAKEVSGFRRVLGTLNGSLHGLLGQCGLVKVDGGKRNYVYHMYHETHLGVGDVGYENEKIRAPMTGIF